MKQMKKHKIICQPIPTFYILKNTLCVCIKEKKQKRIWERKKKQQTNIPARFPVNYFHITP